ncbi:DUF1353 domain-containing protein [bacterium]|nr:DUF1353 domain-containing protein [bacterium]
MKKEQIISIEFSAEPEVKVRVIADNDEDFVKENKKKYPFCLNNTVDVTIITTQRSFTFTICRGYTWNGADIPRFLWRLVGSRCDNDFLIASMLHDYMLEFKVFLIKEILKNQIKVSEYRRLTSLVFREKIKRQGTSVIKANVMAWCVDLFQCCNIRGWKIHEL